MRRTRARGRLLDGRLLGARVREHDRREAHDRAVAGGAWVGGAGIRAAGRQEPDERGANGAADVEARAGAAEMPLAPPADVALELVDRVEAAPLDQALREAERHRRVVRPLTRLQAERPAADHVRQRLERARRAKLDRRADGVAGREAEQRAAVAVATVEAHAGEPTSAARERPFV